MKTLTATLACGLALLVTSTTMARGVPRTGRARPTVHRAPSHVGRPTARPGARPTSGMTRSGYARQPAANRANVSMRSRTSIGDIKGETPRPVRSSGIGRYRPWSSIGDIKGEMPQFRGTSGYRPWSSIGDIKGETPQTRMRGGYRPWATIGDIKGETPQPWTAGGYRPWSAIGDIKGE